jgi:hypothetical protein
VEGATDVGEIAAGVHGQLGAQINGGVGAGVVGAVAEAMTEALAELVQAGGSLFEQRARKAPTGRLPKGGDANGVIPLSLAHLISLANPSKVTMSN